MIFATDYDDDNLLFYQAVDTVPDYPADYVVVSPGLASLPGAGSLIYKSFLSRDEANTTHTSGNADDPLHNLGFLPSTAAHPARTYFYDTNDWISERPCPQPKVLGLRHFPCAIRFIQLQLYPGKVREIYDQRLHPSWQWQIRYLDIFGNTEGGSIPSTLEASAPYTPINVTNFDKNFNSSINNLQALADKVDELDCGPAIFADTNKPTPDDADLFALVDSDTATHLVRNISWADIIAELNNNFQSLTTYERPILSGDMHYHVRTDGNDANTGLVDSAGGAFLTLQRAVDMCHTWDLNGYTIEILIGAGTYNAGVYVIRPFLNGVVKIIGDVATPSNVVINASTPFYVANYSTLWFGGFKLTGAGVGVVVASGSMAYIYGKMEYASATSAHLNCSSGGKIYIISAYTISGSAPVHMSASDNGYISAAGLTITISNTPAWSAAFVYATGLALLSVYSNTYNGASTGTRYYGTTNSVIYVAGAAATYLPGDSAGAVNTGAQYG